MKSKSTMLKRGFTIVELLIVIVIIAILTAITVVYYSGANSKAVVASLRSDLTNAASQLRVFQAMNDNYPITTDCSIAQSSTNICLRTSGSNTFTYTTQPAGSTSPQAFRLNATNSTNSYSVTNSTPPAIATTTNGSTVGSACPAGFIPVPGSGTYATNDFCVMKYAASHSDATSGTQGTSTTPISAPSVQQWINVWQAWAITNSPNVAGCTGCHLITEAEWMTIAQNVLSVPSNWSSGTVGSGYIYSGHNDNAPANALVADPSDSNNYAGETNTGGNQRRTLTLTNGQVIWDLAGNVYEWTAGTTTGGQPGITGEGAFAWKEWTAVTAPGSLTVPATPASIGLSGSSGWNSSRGAGQLYSYVSDASLRGFLRGGHWGIGGPAGVLELYLGRAPGYSSANIGFRVSR